MEHRAFTRKFDQLKNRVETDIGIFPIATGGNPSSSIKINSVKALWDTGATGTAVSSNVIKIVGSSPISFTPVSTGGGIVNAPVHLLNVILPNNVMVPGVRVTELKDLSGCDVLIGMDIIAAGDFALTHKDGRTCFSFRIPSIEHIDFVPQSDEHNFKMKYGFSRQKAMKKSTKKKKK